MSKPLVSDELWTVVEPLLPKEPPKPKGGRSRISDRAALTGTLFVLQSGIPWEMLPPRDGLWQWHDLLARPAYGVLYLFAPISLGIAILCYHLWEIDVLIRRTLVYGTLTTVLAGVYFGVVIAAQAVIQALSGRAGQRPVVLIASTPLVAGLFAPLRRGVQTAIDRRFYRRTYDAARTLEAFRATLVQQVDLEQVQGAILTTVQQIMEPAHVTLWLRSPSPNSRETSSGVESP